MAYVYFNVNGLWQEASYHCEAGFLYARYPVDSEGQRDPTRQPQFRGCTYIVDGTVPVAFDLPGCTTIAEAAKAWDKAAQDKIGELRSAASRLALQRNVKKTIYQG